MRWITVATFVAVVGSGLLVLLGLARRELRYETDDASSEVVLAPGQPLSFYRDDAANTCESLGVQQIAKEFDVAPTPEVAAQAYATEDYADEVYGDGPRNAAYEGCLAGFRSG